MARLPERTAPECVHVHAELNEEHHVEESLDGIEDVGVPSMLTMAVSTEDTEDLIKAPGIGLDDLEQYSILSLEPEYNSALTFPWVLH